MQVSNINSAHERHREIQSHAPKSPRHIRLEPPRARAPPSRYTKEIASREEQRARKAVLVLRGSGSRGIRQPQRAPPTAVPGYLPNMGATREDNSARGESSAAGGGTGGDELRISDSDTTVAAWQRQCAATQQR